MPRLGDPPRARDDRHAAIPVRLADELAGAIATSFEASPHADLWSASGAPETASAWVAVESLAGLLAEMAGGH